VVEITPLNIFGTYDNKSYGNDKTLPLVVPLMILEIQDMLCFGIQGTSCFDT
jgi:hypothetical protein